MAMRTKIERVSSGLLCRGVHTPPIPRLSGACKKRGVQRVSSSLGYCCEGEGEGQKNRCDDAGTSILMIFGAKRRGEEEERRKEGGRKEEGRKEECGTDEESKRKEREKRKKRQQNSCVVGASG